MENTKSRPETEIYDKYWKMTAGLTDIYSKEFTDCLKIIVDYIDTNKKAIKHGTRKREWSVLNHIFVALICMTIWLRELFRI